MVIFFNSSFSGHSLSIYFWCGSSGAKGKASISAFGLVAFSCLVSRYNGESLEINQSGEKKSGLQKVIILTSTVSTSRGAYIYVVESTQKF
mmetsp:Transcript_17728/g.40190  ORF Transcript_17728/g.40190 Transcript_17728/m.40190 type:complete len:91 (+) Transcript_17728:2897-3169(+)